MSVKKTRRIGVLTSGGDAPGLNAVIRAVVKTANGLGYDVLGIEQGFEGLIGEPNFRPLTGADVRGLLPAGGTILHTTNKGHFGGKRVVVRRNVGVETAGAAHVELAAMTDGTERAEGVIDGRHRHGREAHPQAFVQLLGRRMGLVVGDALDDRQPLRGEPQAGRAQGFGERRRI